MNHLKSVHHPINNHKPQFEDRLQTSHRGFVAGANENKHLVQNLRGTPIAYGHHVDHRHSQKGVKNMF